MANPLNALIILLFIFSFHFSFAQDTTITYYDANWEECKKGKSEYFRKSIPINTKKMWINDFYSNGTMQKSGILVDDFTIYKVLISETRKPKYKIKNGSFKYFYKNGNIESEGVYVNDLKYGEWKYYYENGGKEEIIHMVNGQMIGKRITWFENGQRKYDNERNDLGEPVGKWQEWYQNGQLFSEGNHENGVKSGEWVWFFESGQKSASEIYEKGKAVSLSYWNEDGSVQKDEKLANYSPSFPGGEEALGQFLRTNIKYPTIDRRRDVEGMVYITFKVDKNGNLSDVKILKSVSPTIDKEALRAVNKMPDFLPGKAHNLFVDTQVTLPINFGLR